MATPFPIHVTAAQVGTYFVGQYYQVLQHHPEYVHQFYSNASTMIRIDGNARETATAMLQIHTLIMSFNFTGVEIKTVHSLESWRGGVIVMVSGSVLIKKFSGRRKFVQTFFLAPQEKGYFVLSDIFHFIDEEPIDHQSAFSLSPCNVDSKLNIPATIQEPVPNYLIGGEIQSREFIPPADVRENGLVDNYSFHEQRLQQMPESEHVLEDNAGMSNGLHRNALNTVQDHLPALVEEPAGEPQRHTYASIVAKVQSSQVAPSDAYKNVPAALELNHASQPTRQQAVASSNAFERSGVLDSAEEISGIEDEGEIKSVYVRNLPSNISASEIEEEFKKFGKLSSDGVVIRSRKDVFGVRYAFVEFEDISSVRNAIKAATVQIGDQQVFIKERRPNSNIPSRGGRGRGRGRGGYQTEAPRGRSGSRNFSRGGGYDGGERDYYRSRGNGYSRTGPRRQDRNGQTSSESAYN